ncbi:RNA 2',3'-cyclic phosphodiesterase [bacterium]|nr:RNA 2',3'-cyclic phosphodiesterase [bacterium]MBU1985387.1 RNA 2',3'-cyclic phosphodiesterase [bacterium]
MRLFVAIDLPDVWKNTLAEPEASIGWLGRGIRWVEPRGMHLTLKFLGEIEESRLTEIETALRGACAGIVSFTIRLKGTGVFPNPKRPHIFWAGIEAPAELLDLQSRIDTAMQRSGFDKDDHPFRPHLTLARIKDPAGKNRMTEAFLNFKLESESSVVREVLLMRSHLSREGARYEALRRFQLNIREQNRAAVLG